MSVDKQLEEIERALAAGGDGDTKSVSPRELLPKPTVEDTVERFKAAPPRTAAPRDIQRGATVLERVLNTMSSGLYATSGALRGVMDSDYASNPIEGAARGLREHHTYGDWIESGIPEEYRALRVPSFVPLPGGSMPAGPDLTLSQSAHVAGLPLDFALDPVMHGGAGLTKAGQLAKATELGRRYTELHGVDEAMRAAAALEKPAFLEGAAAMPARIRAGHEGVSFGGKVIAPQAQAAVVQGVQDLGARVGGTAAMQSAARALEPVTDALSNLSDAARRMFVFAPELRGIDRDVFLQRLAEKRASVTRAVSEMERDSRELRMGLKATAEEHGISERQMRRVMADAVELAHVPDGTDLTRYMTAEERRKYVRWAYEANAAKQGFGNLQPQLERGVTWLGSRPGGMPNPMRRVTQKSERTAQLMGRAAEPAVEGTRGGSVARTTRSGRGNPEQLSMPSPFQHSEAWLPNQGRMPDELLAGVQPNTARRIREFEANATARAQSAQLNRAIRQAMRVHLGPAFAVGVRGEMRPGLRELVTKINAINAAAIANTRAEGVVVSELDDTINYLRRQMTTAGRRAFDKWGPEEFRGIGREITEKHAEQARRAFRGLTTTQINDMAARGELSILGNKPVPEGIFHEDPFVATGFRVSHAQESIENAQILKDYAQLYGQPAATAPRSWVHVPSDLPELAGVAFPPDIGAALIRQREALRDPSGFVKSWDQVHRVWKKYTLPVIPAYHGRNELGDVWNAVALGGMNPRWFEPATRALFSSGGRQLTTRVGAKAYTGQELLELAERAGVVRTGEVASLERDLATLRNTPEGALRKMGDFIDHNAAVEWAQRFGQARENTTRLALFLDRLAKGYSPQAAAGDVRKFLFDYSQVTEVEQGLIRLIPFYQWTRRNVPLQLQYLWRKPGAAIGFQHARDEAAGGTPLAGEGEPLPRFLEEGLPFPAGTNAEGNPQYLRGEGVLPLADVNVAFDPSQRLVNQLSPYLTAPYEFARNVDLFRSDIPRNMERLERAPGEASNYLGLSVPRRAMPLTELVPGWRLLTELDRANPGGVFGNESQGPMWNRDLPRDYPDPDPTLRLLRVLGTRPYAYDPERSAKRLDRDVKARRRELEDLRDDALARGNTHNADVYQRELDRLDEQPERARK